MLRTRSDLRHHDRAREYKAVIMSGMERIQAITKAVSTTAMTTDSESVRITTVRNNCQLFGIRCPGCSSDDEAGPLLKIVSLKEVLDIAADLSNRL